ncbi:hypothetical protein BIT28_01790 [Photobacterium proteolyticum]|uniref:HD-GYP domain-containing protein n=1 Tax=Photobacterium proteolyticum TaxID=1903952 RepID=A0A1Q9GVA3_9GAMM|nr:hypothetical protein BIT28_01790 [Photobacterium proteolyticum]
MIIEANVATLKDTVRQLHRKLLDSGLAELSRISIALLDEEHIRTYVDSTVGSVALSHHSKRLNTSLSLSQLVQTRKPRVVDDYSCYLEYKKGGANAWLMRNKLFSSYTVPVFFSGDFLGFIFFNSKRKSYFDEQMLALLRDAVEEIQTGIYQERIMFDKIVSLSKFADKASEIRDKGTALHCIRLMELTRIISSYVANTVEITDREMYYLIKFSPLHDIGKIGIPDNILLKAGPLTTDEYAVMKRHVEYGLEMVNAVCDDKVRQHDAYQMIRHIIGVHHEMLDGSGYPNGLAADEINIFSRIVTVADIFDALTSERPYKKAWSVEEALYELNKMVQRNKLDPLCVEALVLYFNNVSEKGSAASIDNRCVISA